jgi:hypothetical protein
VIAPVWPFNSSNARGPVPVLFLHIQKTAGTAIVDSLRPYYGTSMITHGDFIGHEPEEFRDVLFVSGHFGYDYARALMPSRYSFTFLRDPVERVLSFYHFCRAQESAEFSTYIRARQLDLAEFVGSVGQDALIRKNLCNNQAWQLAHGYVLRRGYAVPDELEVGDVAPAKVLALAIAHLAEFSHVGLAETFAADRDVIMAALRLPAAPAAAVAVNSTPGRPRREELPRRTLELIREITALDQSLYDFARRKRPG